MKYSEMTKEQKAWFLSAFDVYGYLAYRIVLMVSLVTIAWKI